MAAYDICFVSTNNFGFAPGGPAGIPRLVFPFDYASAADYSAVVGGGVYPLSCDFDLTVKFYWRLLLLDITLGVDGTPSFGPYIASFQAVRAFVTAVPELELITSAPGVSSTDTYADPDPFPVTVFSGSTTIVDSGIGETQDYGLTLVMFSKGRYSTDDTTDPISYSDYEHLLWQEDNELLSPSVVITGNISIDGPFEGGWTFSTVAPPTTAPPTDFAGGDATIFLSHGGSATIPFYVTGTSTADIVSATMTIAVASTGGWLDYDGKFDPDTGDEV